MTTPPTWPRLRSLGFLARLGVGFAILSLLWGTAGAGFFLYVNQENRDERPGMTIDDIKAHYHGITSEAPMLEALNAGHPEGLPEQDRTALVNWLTGDNVDGNYDNFDLGDAMPADIIALSCLDCHGVQAKTTGNFAEPPLDNWDDIRPLIFSREVNPVNVKVLAASTHTHAIALATLMLVVGIVAFMTSWPRVLINLIVAGASIGLLLDLTSWWIMRLDVAGIENFAYVTAAGGGVFAGGISLLSLLVLLDLCLPKPRVAEKDD